MKARLHRRHRGSALFVAIILVAVLAVVGLAMVNRTTAEMEAVGAKRHHDVSVGCAEAARQMLLSQFRLYGVSPTTLTLNQVVGDRQMLTGHYDTTVAVTSVSATTVGSATQGIRDITNRAVDKTLGGTPYRFTVVCKDANTPSRQVEVEFLVRFGI